MFQPEAKICICTNNQLVIPSVDNSVERRLIYVPFDFQIKKEDPAIEKRLLDELPEILGLILKAGHAYYTAGRNKQAFPPCERITSATTEYIRSQDYIRQFLESCTENSDEKSTISTKEVYKAYCQWYQDNAGDKPMGKKVFFNELIKHNLRPVHMETGNFYRGIRLLLDLEKGVG
jgi:phage/plasmid-associated DNA primase